MIRRCFHATRTAPFNCDLTNDSLCMTAKVVITRRALLKTWLLRAEYKPHDTDEI